MRKHNNKLPNLILDYDESSFHTKQEHSDYLNQTYDIETTVEDFILHPTIPDIVYKHLLIKEIPQSKWPTAGYIWENLAIGFLESYDWHDKMKPVEGFVDMVTELSEYFNIYTGTARHDGSKAAILSTYQRVGVDQYYSGICCVYKHLGNERFAGKPKKEIIEDLPGKNGAFLDDSLNEILKAQEIIPSYLYDPYKINRGQSDVHNFVSSLYEFSNTVKSLHRL
jgi:hypothetical protein